MLMESFEVENFRSLKHLKLEKLARVNLLVGKNNSGKTSVLEAMFLFTGSNVSSWIDHIDSERRMTMIGFAYLFYRFDPHKLIILKSRIKPTQYHGYVARDYEISVTVEAVTELVNRNSVLLPGSSEEAHLYRSDETAAFERIRQLDLTSESDENIDEEPSYEKYSTGDRWMRKGERDAIAQKALLRPAFGHWLGTRMSSTDLYKRIEHVQVAKRDEKIVSILQQIDSRIRRIVLASEDVIYLDLGLDFPSLLPLSLVGDGVQQLLAILAAMAHTPGAIVFIDEIGNGLHYSALRILWKGILQAAREYDVQIVATTHSAEALRHLTWVLDDEEYSDYREDIAAYTLIRADDDTVRTYRHGYSQLEFALEHGVEVRN